MLEFDAKINSYVTSKDGMYMRYSDDFIVILPKDKALPLEQELAFLMSIIHATPSLVLEPDKTQLFECSIGNIESFDIRDALLCMTGKRN